MRGQVSISEDGNELVFLRFKLWFTKKCMKKKLLGLRSSRILFVSTQDILVLEKFNLRLC